MEHLPRNRRIDPNAKGISCSVMTVLQIPMGAMKNIGLRSLKEKYTE